MAPADIAVTLTTAALSGATTKTATLTVFLKFMATTKLKLGLISAIVILGVSTPLIVHYRPELKLQQVRQLLQPSPEQPAHSSEYYQQLHQMADGKERDVKTLGLAFHMYASDHNDQFPTTLEAVAGYFGQGRLSLTGTNDIDIFYKGPLAELGTNTAQGNFILFRDRQTWAGPDGKPTRVYGMADGSVQTVESDDNFRSWETEHSIQ
jgi:hypothetical protein